jgi:biopolymer transport protein ExbB
LLHYEESENEIRSAMTEAALVEIPVMERRVGSISAIAKVAPILGLLGTVLGMIETFQQFEEAGAYVTAGVLSGGLWKALITTAAGLSIGVAARLGHHFLAGRVRSLMHDMEWVGNELLTFLVVQRRGSETVAAVISSPPAE